MRTKYNRAFFSDVLRAVCCSISLVLGGCGQAMAGAPFAEQAQVVAAGYDGAWRVVVHDMDGDGDGDILSSAWQAKRLSWWENRDGAGCEWVERDIAGKFDQPFGLWPADVDGDGDTDVLVTACLWADVQWWENVDGKAGQWKSHIIDTTFTGAYDVAGADMDNDGDIDVVGAAWTDHELRWYENLDGKGGAWAKYLLARPYRRASCVRIADIDRDGDADVVAAAKYDGDIAWWENRKQAKSNWKRHTVEGSLEGACWVHVADIDGDRDLDLVAMGASTNYVHWWENADGVGKQWTEQNIASDANAPAGAVTGDVDGDGDRDIITTAGAADSIMLWENVNGKGTELKAHLITENLEGAKCVTLGDIDNDGDDDLVCAAPQGDTIVLWKSTLADKRRQGVTSSR